MEIICVLSKNGQVLEGKTKLATTPKATLSVKSYLCVIDDAEYKIVDAHAFNISGYAPTPIATATWAGYINALAPVVDDYVVDDVACPNRVKNSEGKWVEPNFPSRYNRPIVYHGDITDFFDYVINVNDLEVHLTTDRLRHPGLNARYIDFNNIVPLINGCGCLPSVDVSDPTDPFMSVKTGASLLRGARRNRSNIQFLDFTDMGDITIIPFHNNASGGVTVSDPVNGLITLTLDDPTVVQNKSFMFFLMGRLVVCDGKYVIDNEDGTITIDPLHLNFAYTALSYMYNTWQFSANSISLDGPNTITDISTLLRSTSYPSFMVVIDVPKLFVTYTGSLSRPTDKTLLYPKNCTGLLVDMLTGLVHECITTHFDDDTLVSIDEDKLSVLHIGNTDNHMHKVALQRVPRWFMSQEITGSHKFAVMEIFSALE